MKTFLTLIMLLVLLCPAAYATPPNQDRSKFYDFNEQVIDGEIRRPTTLYTDARERARFERLLRLKRSFLPRLFETSKHRVFN